MFWGLGWVGLGRGGGGGGGGALRWWWVEEGIEGDGFEEGIKAGRGEERSEFGVGGRGLGS